MKQIQSIINFLALIIGGVALFGVGVIFISGMKGATKADVTKNYNEIVKNYKEIKKVGNDVIEVFNKAEEIYNIATENKILNTKIESKQGEIIDILNLHGQDLNEIKEQTNNIYDNTETILYKITP